MKKEIIISLLCLFLTSHCHKIINVANSISNTNKAAFRQDGSQGDQPQGQQGSQQQPTPQQALEQLKKMKKQLFNDENFNTDEIRQKNLAYDISYSSFHMSLSMMLRIEDWLGKMNINIPKSELKSAIFPEARAYSYSNPQDQAAAK